MDLTTIIVSAISALIGGGAMGGGVFAFLISKRKQTFDLQQSLLEHCEKRIKSLEAEEEACQRRLLEMQSQNADLQRDIEGLKAAVSRLELVSINAVVIADKSGAIVHWSAPAERMFGWKREEAVGQNVTLLTPARFLYKHRTMFAQAVANKKEITNRILDGVVVDKSGNEFAVSIIINTWVEGNDWRASAEFRRVGR